MFPGEYKIRINANPALGENAVEIKTQRLNASIKSNIPEGSSTDKEVTIDPKGNDKISLAELQDMQKLLKQISKEEIRISTPSSQKQASRPNNNNKTSGFKINRMTNPRINPVPQRNISVLVPHDLNPQENKLYQSLVKNGYRPSQNFDYSNAKVSVNNKSSQAIMLTIMEQLDNEGVNIFKELEINTGFDRSVNNSEATAYVDNTSLDNDPDSIYNIDNKAPTSLAINVLRDILDPKELVAAMLTAILSLKDTENIDSVTVKDVFGISARLVDQISADPDSANIKTLTKSMNNLKEAIKLMTEVMFNDS